MNRRTFIKRMGFSAAGLFLSGCGFDMFSVAGKATPTETMANSAEKNLLANLLYRVSDADAPVVYFTRDISANGLYRAYEALGRPAKGKTGIKISFESPDGPYLSPGLLKKIRDKTDGTFLDSNGFTPPRNTTEGNLNVAKAHGFTAIGPVDVLDADGDIDMPVTGGYHLKYARTGSHFDWYDSIISVTRFKAHHLPTYGGTIKNITITLASISGKAILHSAGKNEDSYINIDATTREQSFADGAQAAMNYKKDCWTFLNVLDDFEPDDKCDGTTNLGNIGILSSLDPVAVDQAAVDMTFGAASTPQLRETWEAFHNVKILHYAENLDVGKRHYRLVTLD